MRPIVGVEFDDSSHKRADRQERDEFVDSVFKAAEFPLVHVPTRSSYSISELTELLSPELVGAFKSIWRTLVSSGHSPLVAQLFFYMRGEKFWHHVPNHGFENWDSILQFAGQEITRPVDQRWWPSRDNLDKHLKRFAENF